MKISAAVITKNEESNIRDCLNSLKWTDEIIIVDSNSTDNTIKIAKEYTDKIFPVDFNEFAAKRKYSLTKASNEWILFIDADERITNELREEILNLVDGDVSGYYINRKNYYLGRWIKHCGLYPDYQLRLFIKNKAAVTPRKIHEGVEISGQTDRLNNHILHNSYSDLHEMIKKANYYSKLEAEEHFAAGKTVSKAGVFFHAFATFSVMFFSRGGYKDGIYGFFVSFQYALNNFLTYVKLLKLGGGF